MNPYIIFNGNCREALARYQQVLGAKLLFQTTWAESPMADQAEGCNGGSAGADAIMHATLQLPDGSLLMASDCPPEYFKPMQGFSLSVNAASVEEGERLFNGLSDGGQVTMPLEKTFWAERFGMCTDRFGTPWMVNCEMKAP